MQRDPLPARLRTRPCLASPPTSSQGGQPLGAQLHSKHLMVGQPLAPLTDTPPGGLEAQLSDDCHVSSGKTNGRQVTRCEIAYEGSSRAAPP